MLVISKPISGDWEYRRSPHTCSLVVQRTPDSHTDEGMVKFTSADEVFSGYEVHTRVISLHNPQYC